MSSLAISARNIRKAYGATIALDDASFSVEPGTVHALLGENGAGKSTLVKILSGLVQPNSGQLDLFGEPVRLDNPLSARRLGLQTAFQEMTQIRNLTVVQNLLLPDEPTNRWGGVRRREAE